MQQRPNRVIRATVGSNLKTAVTQLTTAGIALPSDSVKDTTTHMIRQHNASLDTQRWRDSRTLHAIPISRQTSFTQHPKDRPLTLLDSQTSTLNWPCRTHGAATAYAQIINFINNGETDGGHNR